MSSIQTIEEFIPLPLGKTFVRWDFIPQIRNDNPSTKVEEDSSTPLSLPTDDPPLLFMLHGATVPNWQFDDIVEELLGNSTHEVYRILRMDLYGHGQSARPKDVRYNLNLFVEQVLDVLGALNLLNDDINSGKKRLVGIGHSMGSAVLSAVASSATTTRSTVFQQLILVAPMLDYITLNPHSRLLNIPIVGENLMQYAIIPKLKERRRQRYGAIGKAELGERFVKDIEYTAMSSGDNDDDDAELTFDEVLLRMFRHGAVGDQSEVYQSLGDVMQSSSSQRSIKVHVMHGSNDTVANGKQIEQIIGMLGKKMECSTEERRWNTFDCNACFGNGSTNNDELDRTNHLEERGVTYTELDGLEHNMLLSHPQVCANIMSSFLLMSDANH